VSTLNHRININFQTNTSQLEDARKKLKELEKLYDDISSGKATPGAGGLQNITAQINQQKANIKIFERENTICLLSELLGERELFFYLFDS
jgi:hypothetical protein